MKRILVVEPYWGDSHRQFIEGLTANIKASYSLLVLPARAWKGKMQLAAAWCVAELEKMPADQRLFDCVLCSTFVDVSVLRAMLSRKKWWAPDTRFYLYFHENQIAYPNQIRDAGRHQFALINFNSALASDSIAFNSEFNRRTFLTGCQQYLHKFHELDLGWAIEEINERSRILYPPVDFTRIDSCATTRVDDVGAPVIVWNHRWEHDKGVYEFFDILAALQDRGVQFHLILLGEVHPELTSFQGEICRVFSENLLHCGYAATAEEYQHLLCRGDIVVSTAAHEFFGISVVEAIRAGCMPVLPDDLAYRELYPREYLYQKGQCLEMLLERTKAKKRLRRSAVQKLTDRFSWQDMRKNYESWLGVKGELEDEWNPGVVE